MGRKMQGSVNQSVTFDETIDALADVQRRHLLVDLVTGRPDYKVNAVLKETPKSGEPRRQRYVQLVHIHLPRLEEYGLIRWDRDADEVSRGPAFEQIRPVVELLHDHKDELPEGWV